MLKGEVETAPEHSKIVLWPIDHAEAQVISPTDMPRESDFETGSKLTDYFGFATEVFGLRIDSEGIRRSLCVKGLPFAAAENRTHTRPRIRSEARARN